MRKEKEGSKIMVKMIAFSKSGISVFRQFDEVSDELIDNVIDLSSERGFSCSRVLVFNDNEVVYDFERGVSVPVSRRKDLEFRTLRKVNKGDMHLLRKAYAKALANLNIANFIQ